MLMSQIEASFLQTFKHVSVVGEITLVLDIKGHLFIFY